MGTKASKSKREWGKEVRKSRKQMVRWPSLWMNLLWKRVQLNQRPKRRTSPTWRMMRMTGCFLPRSCLEDMARKRRKNITELNVERDKNFFGKANIHICSLPQYSSSQRIQSNKQLQQEKK